MHRTLRRAAAAGVSITALLGAAVAAAPAASAATPCQSDCISGLTATPYPDGLRLAVSTSAPTLVSAEIWFGQTKVKSFAPAAGAALSTSQAYELKSGLSQGVWYRYVVKAADSYGNVRTEEGTLRTSKRDLNVFFDKIKLTNDSDTWSAGDIYELGSKAGSSATGFRQNPDTHQWTDGGTYGVPSDIRVQKVPGAKQGTAIAFSVADDDAELFDSVGICVVGHPCLPSFTTGTTDSEDWATASGSLALPTASGSASGTFSISSPGGARLIHTVTGTWVQHIRNVTSPVRSLVATPYNTSVRLTWSAPADLGGLSVTGFRVLSGQSVVATLPPSARQYDATGLANGVSAAFSVVAVNAEGDSAPASASATPKAVPGAVAFVSATPGDAVVKASWTPSALPSDGTTQYRVYVNDVLRTTVATPSATVPAANGTAAVVKVVPFNALGEGQPALSASVTPYKASTIGGWSTVQVTAASGTTFSPTLSVSCGTSAGRPLYLQRRLQGGTAWVNYGTIKANAGCSAVATIPVSIGIWEWRAYAPAWGAWGPAVTPVRTVAAKTTISGWDTAAKTVATGWVTLDDISITPGNQRSVWVIGRPVGAPSGSIVKLWSGYASSTGQVFAKILAQKGAWEYCVLVPPSYAHGEQAYTAYRRITGT